MLNLLRVQFLFPFSYHSTNSSHAKILLPAYTAIFVYPLHISKCRISHSSNNPPVQSGFWVWCLIHPSLFPHSSNLAHIPMNCSFWMYLKFINSYLDLCNSSYIYHYLSHGWMLRAQIILLYSFSIPYTGDQFLWRCKMIFTVNRNPPT